MDETENAPTSGDGTVGWLNRPQLYRDVQATIDWTEDKPFPRMADRIVVHSRNDLYGIPRAPKSANRGTQAHQQPSTASQSLRTTQSSQAPPSYATPPKSWHGSLSKLI